MNRYKDARLIVIASTMHSEGGDWRSIYALARHLELRGEGVPIINLGSKRSFRQMLAALVFGQRVLVNGLSTAMRWPVLLACLFRKDIALYLHETSYMLDIAERENSMRFNILKKILKRNPLICVSEQSERLYQNRFQAEKTTVAYECLGGAPKKPIFDTGCKHIVMVGSINERKGVRLFSEVADLAADHHPDWRFHWVGALATTESIYRSDKVTWHGWQWHPRDIVKQCDLFFLSSVDDPCPLSALEAGTMGKRIVAYRKTGTAEIIENLPGCAVYESHEAEVALSAIAKALNNKEPIAETIKEAFLAVASLESFAMRIDKAISSKTTKPE